MGFFSYNCKECGHPLLSPGVTDPGINDWMSQGVILTPRGSIILGEYDGYGRCGEAEDIDNCACLHEACWEKAGKPNWKHYGSPSDSARDQGYFFNDGAHDLIDPRITEGRDELLAKGIEARKARRYDQKARDVWEMVNEAEHCDRKRFSYGQCYLAGKGLIDNKFYFRDHFGERFKGDDAYFHGTESDAKGMVEKMTAEFLASDEAKALVARYEEIRAEGKRKYVEKLRETGRYEVGHRPSKKPGDKVDNWTSLRTMYYVRDNVTYETVAEFDFDGEAKSFTKQDGYQGNASPEWEARVIENGRETEVRRDKAKALAQKLNSEWADAGFPVV